MYMFCLNEGIKMSENIFDLGGTVVQITENEIVIKRTSKMTRMSRMNELSIPIVLVESIQHFESKGIFGNGLLYIKTVFNAASEVSRLKAAMYETTIMYTDKKAISKASEICSILNKVILCIEENKRVAAKNGQIGIDFISTLPTPLKDEILKEYSLNISPDQKSITGVSKRVDFIDGKIVFTTLSFTGKDKDSITLPATEIDTIVHYRETVGSVLFKTRDDSDHDVKKYVGSNAKAHNHAFIYDSKKEIEEIDKFVSEVAELVGVDVLILTKDTFGTEVLKQLQSRYGVDDVFEKTSTSSLEKTLKYLSDLNEVSVKKLYKNGIKSDDLIVESGNIFEVFQNNTPLYAASLIFLKEYRSEKIKAGAKAMEIVDLDKMLTQIDRPASEATEQTYSFVGGLIDTMWQIFYGEERDERDHLYLELLPGYVLGLNSLAIIECFGIAVGYSDDMVKAEIARARNIAKKEIAAGLAGVGSAIGAGVNISRGNWGKAAAFGAGAVVAETYASKSRR